MRAEWWLLMSLLARILILCVLLILPAAGAPRLVAPLPVETAAPTVVAQLPATATATPPLNAVIWFPSSPTPVPSATATPTATPEPSATATVVPSPTVIPINSSANLELGSGNFRHNILTALNANGGALRRVTVAPGATFSFVGTLGARPYRLPWRDVALRPASAGAGRALYRPRLQEPVSTALPPFSTIVTLPGDPRPFVTSLPAPTAPAESSPPDAPPPSNTPPTPTATPPPELIRGGGICDLASRFVIAARPLLPQQAFQFQRHSGGLRGVANRDAVAIWFEGRPTDLDLRITNLTDRWLVFTVVLERNSATVTATLQGQP